MKGSARKRWELLDEIADSLRRPASMKGSARKRCGDDLAISYPYYDELPR